MTKLDITFCRQIVSWHAWCNIARPRHYWSHTSNVLKCMYCLWALCDLLRSTASVLVNNVSFFAIIKISENAICVSQVYVTPTKIKYAAQLCVMEILMSSIWRFPCATNRNKHEWIISCPLRRGHLQHKRHENRNDCIQLLIVSFISLTPWKICFNKPLSQQKTVFTFLLLDSARDL